jgi:hypothetical protein
VAKHLNQNATRDSLGVGGLFPKFFPSGLTPTPLVLNIPLPLHRSGICFNESHQPTRAKW